MVNDRYRDGSNWLWKGRASVAVAGTGKPSAPTGLASSAETTTTAALTWTLSVSSGIVEQRIYRNNQFLVSVGPTETTYLLTGLTPDTTATYKITAHNGTENSGFSNSATVTTLAETTPDPPGQVIGVNAVSDGPNSGSVTWSAPATGGTPTGYRVYLDGVQHGVDQGSTVFAMTITGLEPSTLYSVTVSAFNADGEGTQSTADTFTTESGSTDPVLFAGHIPGRSFFGVSTPGDGSAAGPGHTEQMSIIGQPIYCFREFVSGTATLSNGRSMMTTADAENAYGVISWKPGNFVDVSNGLHDNQLTAIYDLAVERRSQGKRPFAAAFHHEPAGDPQGNLAQWAAMNAYCSYWLAGRRGGTATSTYVAAHDVRDMVSWAGIGNGFWWRTFNLYSPSNSDANTAWPQYVLDAFRENGGLILNDFYDADYINQTGALTNPDLRHPGTGVRTSARMVHFMNWYNSKVPNRDIACGAGEMGCINGSEITECWKVIRANRDVWAVSFVFSSMVNSDHDWRVIPNDYPITNPVYTSGKGLVDFGGGNPSGVDSSGVRLTHFINALEQSNSILYGGTGPNVADI